MSYMFWIWVAVCVASIGVEIASPSLTSVWFLAGGLVALILSCFEIIDWYWQLLAFIAVSVICLFAFRPLAKKLLLKTQNETNAETFKDRQARLISNVTFDALGTVVLNGVIWSVRSHNGENIAAGEIVRIVAMDGNKLVVEKIK
ncbi:MAG: NfeD family protein [Clostridia bacterium]|nr:NfeD family protein [Clostridia bacterium]